MTDVLTPARPARATSLNVDVYVVNGGVSGWCPVRLDPQSFSEAIVSSSVNPPPSRGEETVSTATGGRGASRAVVAEQRERFGGMKFGACFFGWLTATGTAVILTALLTAVGAGVGLARDLTPIRRWPVRRPSGWSAASSCW